MNPTLQPDKRQETAGVVPSDEYLHAGETVTLFNYSTGFLRRIEKNHRNLV